MNKQKGFTLSEFIVFLIWLVFLVGWIWNIVKIAQADFTPLTGVLVLRIVGVFVAPLGGVMGYL